MPRPTQATRHDPGVVTGARGAQRRGARHRKRPGARAAGLGAQISTAAGLRSRPSRSPIQLSACKRRAAVAAKPCRPLARGGRVRKGAEGAGRRKAHRRGARTPRRGEMSRYGLSGRNIGERRNVAVLIVGRAGLASPPERRILRRLVSDGQGPGAGRSEDLKATGNTKRQAVPPVRFDSVAMTRLRPEAHGRAGRGARACVRPDMRRTNPSLCPIDLGSALRGNDA